MNASVFSNIKKYPEDHYYTKSLMQEMDFPFQFDMAYKAGEIKDYSNDMNKMYERNLYWLKTNLPNILDDPGARIAVFGQSHARWTSNNEKIGILDFLLDLQNAENRDCWTNLIGANSPWFGLQNVKVERLWSDASWRDFTW